MPNNITSSEVLAVAKKYIGTKEDPPNSNHVIFNTKYYGREVSGKQYPWCCAFVWCVFNEIGASHLFFGGKKTASCGALMRYAKSHGQWVDGNYKPGDLVIFDWTKDGNLDTNHIGIVESLNNHRSLITIEGNTAVGNDSNGGEVMRRKRDISWVVGAVRPKYKERKVESKLTVEKAKEVIRAKAGLSSTSIEFLYNYRYGDDLLKKLAEAMK